MSFNSYPLLKSVFTYFGRASVRTRQRWGTVLGGLVHRFASRRRHIVRTNLDLCFPDTPESTRREWEKQHFRLLAQSYLDRGLLWFGLPSTILNTLHLTGEEHITQALEQGRKVMLLVPHFLGMDAAGTRLSMSISPLVAFYTPQRDPHVDRLMYEGRSRFSSVPLISRKDGIRGLMRALQKGQPIYYLPDMDFGTKGSAFVPFFNVPAATLLLPAIAETVLQVDRQYWGILYAAPAIGALQLGYRQGKTWVYAGKVGTGYTHAMLVEIRRQHPTPDTPCIRHPRPEDRLEGGERPPRKGELSRGAGRRSHRHVVGRHAARQRRPGVGDRRDPLHPQGVPDPRAAERPRLALCHRHSPASRRRPREARILRVDEAGIRGREALHRRPSARVPLPRQSQGRRTRRTRPGRRLSAGHVRQRRTCRTENG